MAIETPRLIIKIPTMANLKDWIELHSQSEAMSAAPEIVKEWLANDIRHFAKHGFGMGSVYEKASGRFIGRAGLVYLDHDDTQTDIEIGYVFHKDFWNKGYGVEVAKAALEWGFAHLQVNKLVAVTRLDNKKSQALLKKIGMRYEKTIQLHQEDFLYYVIYKK